MTYWLTLAAIATGWTLFAILLLSGAATWAVLGLLVLHLSGVYWLTRGCHA